jgi:hypothetical protein
MKRKLSKEQLGKELFLADDPKCRCLSAFRLRLSLGEIHQILTDSRIFQEEVIRT